MVDAEKAYCKNDQDNLNKLTSNWQVIKEREIMWWNFCEK